MTVYLTPEQVLELHGEAIAAFGGTSGIRDTGALASALAQPAMEAFGVELYPSLTEKAAAYLFFLARNHAFVDGNKRTAYAAAYVFLLLNGAELTGPDDAVFDLVLRTAQGQLPDPRAVADGLGPLVTVQKQGYAESKEASKE
ncbi:type II toxin-antitoxin system death-on-curing family toxin (plasmid) [Deinococcus metallilatus]|uniref:Death-on-curing protein n=1 Tax=Deinococcus metallilatus TaxID=1211322 RepID=A0AAJ5F5N9_9DEIO|nr:type II toxin-antitoxin system death-on-curing family toxin [Deinococcus metallilatus]MBB5297296.1 death-on-curing protein [Deinococcus metallilatus]QBY06958.1 type II toxin-antitoxin system death-on-curing family toxin [Deinococcus metallilatus]TLK31905.1 type II toxin-antitoxin system death-on-curing family toxin [Deinococcus metallilatus]GMA17140.1 death-on-curing protein [Deinococcus metallilatus]